MREANPAPYADGSVSGRTRWRILVVLLTVIFMSLIGVSIVNVALPTIQQDLGASQADLQWVLSGYALTFGVVLVAAGRAGDIMGRGGFFIIGVGVFTAASVAAGLAPDPTWLNLARFLQGLGSGLLNPQGLGMIQDHFRGAERGRAFGYFGAAVGVSVAVGPILGGLLIALGGPALGWRLTFLINLPLGILAIVLAFLWFPKPLFRHVPKEARGSGTTAGSLRALDPIGSLLLGLAVLAILFPFVESRASVFGWLLLPVGAGLTFFWLQWERRRARLGFRPMVDLNLFATRSFSNGATIMALYFMGMTSVWVLVALYVQIGDGKSALESGLFGLPAALLSAYAAHWAGKRVMTQGRKLVVGGLLVAVFGLGLSIAVILLHAAGYLSIWWLLLSLAFVGVAQGVVISPNQTLTLAEVPLAYAGSSGAIMQTGQRIGTSVGIAVITAVVFALLPRTTWASAVTVGFGLIGGIVLLAVGVGCKDLHDRAKASRQPARQ